jgi:sortase A
MSTLAPPQPPVVADEYDDGWPEPTEPILAPMTWRSRLQPKTLLNSTAPSIGFGLLALAILSAFTLWFSGARTEPVQRAGFAAFARTQPVIVDGTLATKPWPSGVPAALLRISSYDRNLAVFPGASKSDTTRGPAYDPDTAFPGSIGNTVILGRGSSYGSPFSALAQLAPGDHLILTTPAGTVAYAVTEVLAVDKHDPKIYEETTVSRLSLLTQRGKFWSSNRTLVRAEVVAGEMDAAVRMPKINPTRQRPFGPILLGALVVIAFLIATIGREVLTNVVSKRAAIILVIPLLAALALPIIEEILLLLPRVY